MIVQTVIFSAIALGMPRFTAYGSTPNRYAMRNASAYMIPYQWIGSGPRCRTGSTLMVMKPAAPGLADTAVMMRAVGGRMHLEDSISTLRSDPLDGVSRLDEPRRERVGAEVALHHQRRHRRLLELPDPAAKQVVERGLARPHGGIGVHGGEAKRV